VGARPDQTSAGLQSGTGGVLYLEVDLAGALGISSLSSQLRHQQKKTCQNKTGDLDRVPETIPLLFGVSRGGDLFRGPEFVETRRYSRKPSTTFHAAGFIAHEG
jgi:hypothetical protein